MLTVDDMLQAIQEKTQPESIAPIVNAWDCEFFIWHHPAKHFFSTHATDVYEAIAKWLQHCVETERGCDPLDSSIRVLIGVSLSSDFGQSQVMNICRGYRQATEPTKAAVRMILSAQHPGLFDVPYLEVID